LTALDRKEDCAAQNTQNKSMNTFKILLITGKTLGKHIDTFNAGREKLNIGLILFE
jgi:hypothetical protein